MKWTVDQLNKIASSLYIDEVIDYSGDIEEYSDIYKISDTVVTGGCHIIADDTFMFGVNIKTTLTMACAVTLEEVEYEIDINDDIIFAPDHELDDDAYLIDGITIDLKKAIFYTILVNKPMKIVKEGAENLFKSEEEAIEEKIDRDRINNNPFIDLAKKFEEEE